MGGRFQASKFKNTHPKTPKREDCVTDLPIGGLSCTNNGISAGRTFLAFHVDGEGGKLGVLRNDAKGRKTRDDLSILAAHPDGASDFDFLPFENDVLATVSRSDGVKLWSLSPWDENGNPAVGQAAASISLGDEDGGDCLMTHPTAGGVLAAGAALGAYILDLDTAKSVARMELAERAQSGGWDGEGRTLLVQDRANRLCLFDPRSGAGPTTTNDDVHQGKGREGRAMFLGSEGKILTSGFSKMRQREIFLYDVRKFSAPMHAQPFESSTGIIIPLYDPDTKLIFLSGKGSNKIHLCELLNKPPFLGEVGSNSPPEQTLGACLVPKWGLDVMSGEVARFVQLNRNSLFPVSCCVPRKTYRDFLPELFQPTAAATPGAKAADWLNGDNTLPPKYSLDPADEENVNKVPVTATPKVAYKPKETVSDIIGIADTPKETPKEPPPMRAFPPSSTPAQDENHSPSNGTNGSNGHKEDPVVLRGPSNGNGHSNGKESSPEESRPPKIDVTVPYAERPKSEFVGLSAPSVRLRDSTRPAPAANRNTIAVPAAKSLFGVRTKFKHTGVKMEITKAKIFYNLRKVNTQLPLECGGFCVSDKWAAVPMAGASGLIAVFDLSQPEKVPDGLIPGLENGGAVADLRWDPFNPDRLLVGLDTGIINIWNVPSNGVSELMDTPAKSWNAHSAKLLCVDWNPVATDVVVSAAVDGEVILWDAGEATPSPKVRLDHPKAPLCLAWSANGDRLATAAKDGVVRIYSPLSSDRPEKEAPLLGSIKAARLIWVCNDEFLLLSGFSKSSQREVSLLRADTLEQVAQRSFDQASVLLIPHFDFDTNILFLTGKGDVTLQIFEVLNKAPWFLDIPAFKGKQPHQALSFHSKRTCDVGNVEFMKCWRLKLNEIQPMSFTVPRRYMDKYQNDIFPEALARWSASCGAADWFGGRSPGPRFQDLNPGMDLLYPEQTKAAAAAAPKPAPLSPKPVVTAPKPTSKEDIMSSMSVKMETAGREGLEQDAMEGVAEEEWKAEDDN